MEKKKRGGGGREGWFIRKNHVVGIFVLFCTCLVSVPGALRRDSSTCAWNLCPLSPPSPCLGYQRSLNAGQLPDRAWTPRLALSQSQARPLVTQTLCAFSFASRDRGVCGSASSLRVCVRLCVCVYLKRTELSCLICTMGGGLKLPA